jgi:hypothetical protein
MENKNKLLRDLGYSDELIQAFENNSVLDYSFIDSQNSYSSFESIELNPVDLNEITLEKTDKPINLFYTDFK